MFIYSKFNSVVSVANKLYCSEWNMMIMNAELERQWREQKW